MTNEKRIKKIVGLVPKLEECEFECQGGYLTGCEYWIDLKEVLKQPENYIERMEEELEELEERIGKLNSFLNIEFETPTRTTEEERRMLFLQLKSMSDYRDVLIERISIAKKKEGINE